MRKWLLWTLAALLLAGCSLARPEAAGEGGGDRLAGFYVVQTTGHSESFYENKNLEEYGSFSAETGQFGTLNFPQSVLFAVEDEAGNYVFPGMEDGYSLFLVEKVEEYGPVSKMVSNMAPGQEGNSIHVTDEGTSNILNGTIYCAKRKNAVMQEHDSVWKFYRVYQTGDGRVYLNGDGNTFGASSSFGCTESETKSITSWDGKTITESIDIHIWVETIDPLERLVVTQFDEGNAIVRSDDLALREELPEVNCEAETAWVLVEETRGDGTARTIYNVPGEGGEPVSHMVVLLDDEGMGKLSYLTVRAK